MKSISLIVISFLFPIYIGFSGPGLFQLPIRRRCAVSADHILWIQNDGDHQKRLHIKKKLRPRDKGKWKPRITHIFKPLKYKDSKPLDKRYSHQRLIRRMFINC